MKRAFLTTAFVAFAGFGAASAADLPNKAAPMAPAAAPVAYNWTGCYIGVEGGGNWGRSRETDVTSPNPAFVGRPLTGDFNLAGVLLGGTVGCNYQVGSWVFGVENDYSWTSKSGAANDVTPFNNATINHVSEKWIDTLRGRVGVTWDRALFYGTGGVAFAGTDVSVCPPGLCVEGSRSRTGWVAGLGVEYALWQSLSLKIEYLHADFGTGRYIDPPVTTIGGVIIAGGGINTRDVRLTDDIVRAGLNWRFNWGGPVVARY